MDEEGEEKRKETFGENWRSFKQKLEEGYICPTCPFTKL